MTTIAQIVERIRRDDPVASQIAEECKRGILDKATLKYDSTSVYEACFSLSEKANREGYYVHLDNAKVIVCAEMSDVEFLSYDRRGTPDRIPNPQKLYDFQLIITISVTFRPREGSKP